ncbi:hypothetical protein JL720_17110 [Aureococcus anophagefferens]|nr:hypothetical protein JL720_17110 [Aureococcus anophagefferens]
MSDGDKLVEMSVSVNGETTNPMASSAYDSLRQDSPRPGNRAPSTGEAGAADDAWQSVSRTFFFSVIAVMNQVTFGYDVGAVSQCLVPIQKTFHLTTLEVGAVTSALNYFAAGGALVGLGVGASWASSGIYVTEIAPSHKRGALVSLVDVSINLGIVVGYVLAYVIDSASIGRAFGVAPWRVAMGRDAHAAGDDVVEGTWAGAAASKEGKYAALLGVAQQAAGTEAILYFAPTVLPKHNPFDAFLGNVGIGLAKFGGEVVRRNRAKSSALSCFLNRITSACVALSFLPLSQAWGASAVFFSYAAVAAACTGLYAATLPDTLGKSLEQIGAQAGEAGLVVLRGYEVAGAMCADDRDRAHA